MKNRAVLITLAVANLLLAIFIFAAGLTYVPHTVRNLSIIGLRLVVHVVVSGFLLLMLREGGLRRRDGQFLACFFVFSVIAYFVAVFA